jgi:hypothetical protein
VLFFIFYYVRQGAGYFLHASGCQGKEFAHAAGSAIAVEEGFPQVYESVSDDGRKTSTFLRVELPLSFNRDLHRRTWIFARRSMTLVRHAQGEVEVELSTYGSVFSPIVKYSAFVAKVDRAESFWAALSKVIPMQQKFLLAKGCE